MTERTSSDGRSNGLELQDKQDKSTATTAKIGKNRIEGLVGCRAFIYGLSEAIGPLF
jgi:hypothetical protein